MTDTSNQVSMKSFFSLWEKYCDLKIEAQRLQQMNEELIAVAKMAMVVAKMELRIGEGYPEFSPQDLLCAAEAAIAKATGESND